MLLKVAKREINKQISFDNLKAIARIGLNQLLVKVELRGSRNKILLTRLGKHLIKAGAINLTGVDMITSGPNGVRRTFAGMGDYILHYGKGRREWIHIRISLDTSLEIADTLITLTTFKSNGDAINDLLEMVYPFSDRLPEIIRAESRGRSSGGVVGVIPDHYGTSEQFIEPEVYAELDEVFNRMVNDPDWYKDRNLVRKETLLLFGPPGTGKSTIVKHFASKYRLDIVLIKPSQLSSITFLPRARPRIYLMEEIDSDTELLIPVKAKEGELRGFAGARDEDNYSDFTNALDGVVPMVDSMVIMTTNYAEKLRPSIIRKGRVDRKIFLGRLSTQRVLDICCWKEGDERHDYIKKTRSDGDIEIGLIPELKTITSLDSLISLLDREDKLIHLKTHTPNPNQEVT